VIGGQWLLVGRQPATDPSPIVYPWTPGMSSPSPAGTVIEPTGSQIVDDQLLWYAAIPAAIDAVGVGHLEGNTVVITSQHPTPHRRMVRRSVDRTRDAASAGVARSVATPLSAIVAT
jgi:hypothetical protein